MQIGRTSFKAGEKITGVSEARCEHLLGRFVELVDTDGDLYELHEMTVPQLESMAAELEIKLPSGAKKAEIVEAIEAATTEGDE